MQTIKNIYFEDGKTIQETLHLYDGIYHRVDGPAIITYYFSGVVQEHTYYNFGKCHRLNGPAWTAFDELGKIRRCEYWIDYKEYTDIVEYHKKCKIFNIK